MSSNNSNSSSALGGAILVSLVFVVLKWMNLTPIASLDWLWIFSPVLIVIAWNIAWAIIGSVILGIVAAVAGGVVSFNRPSAKVKFAGRGGYRGLPNNEKAHSAYPYGAGRRS